MRARKGYSLPVGIGLGIVIVLAAVPGRGVTRVAPADQPPDGRGKLTKVYFGVKLCAECHTERGNQQPVLCRCVEVAIWQKYDKHKIANKVLEDPRSLRMAELMGLKGKPAENKTCVSCHGVWVEDPKEKHSSFSPADGVSCVACHGEHKEWVNAHAAPLEREAWRSLTPEEKEAKYGLRNLWDPVTRATLCASCHIGNAAEGKVVTHAMYAAGHPTLPGLEVATFSDQMPYHWEYLRDKNSAAQKILNYDPARSNLERTEMVLVAGLVSLRESMKLLADASTTQEMEKRWPELAQFDCYACHHDLKTKSWRQERGYAGIPGRPAMRPWPTALAELGTSLAADDNKKTDFAGDFRSGLADLTRAFDARPFGDPMLVAKAARKMVVWADQLLPEVRKHPIDRQTARRLLARLTELPKAKRCDYDSARQIAWAFRVIHDEAYPDKASPPGVVKGLKDLNELLKLDLPPGQVQIVNSLRHSLDCISAFEPGPFEKLMRDLATKTVGAGK